MHMKFLFYYIINIDVKPTYAVALISQKVKAVFFTIIIGVSEILIIIL